MLGLVEAFDLTWSRFRDDGSVGRLRAGATVDLGPGAAELLEVYDRLDAVTDGAVNPLVGGSLEHLGYDADYTLRARGVPVPAAPWSAAQRQGDRLTVPRGSTLDVGAAGKGRLVDLVAAATGVPCVVDAGGDILNLGSEALRVALEHPGDPSRAVGVAVVSPGQALCGSAVNRRAWGEGLHHVLDARTGAPVDGVVATWAVADTAMTADAVSTALFHAAPERIAAAFAYRHVTIDAEGLRASDDFPGELFA
ncbi:hypothetical protein HMPREF0063_12716 [Aeromicrobium marinum DSM 15272]|uniref:FAD:protein FMN transferase n=1 Tax=Aeromicrobium marinum DSM 15272 TaxID=585531 RepID=E2SFA7_9ACTN|nr:hypothetical protein HMPREF0063_12716 [Aeromicrobium marinum DSM 15272]